MPVELSHVWGWFEDLRCAVGGGFGPIPISYTEIDSYARRMRTHISPFETQLIRRIDKFAVAAGAHKKPAEHDGTAVSITDAVGVKGVLKGLGIKPRKRKMKGGNNGK